MNLGTSFKSELVGRRFQYIGFQLQTLCGMLSQVTIFADTSRADVIICVSVYGESPDDLANLLNKTLGCIVPAAEIIPYAQRKLSGEDMPTIREGLREHMPGVTWYDSETA